MKRSGAFFAFLFLLLPALSGCGIIGEKAASISVIYGAISFFSLILLIGYCVLVYKKEIWFIFLFTAVFTVNLGYFLLSVSETLDAALFSNRLSYFGSVFLPMIMFVIITKECRIDLRNELIGVLTVISLFVFLLAASPGYLDIYYKSVALAKVNGVSVLEKVYGPFHSVYLFYLLFYFGAMVGIIIYSRVERKIEKPTHAAILAGSVFVNICVWLLQQLVRIDFELLSVSYIVSELFLLGIHLLLRENEEDKARLEALEEKTNAPVVPSGKSFAENLISMVMKNDEENSFSEALSSLTPTERKIYEFHLSGKKTKEIMDELCITENTVKFHNKNIYRKFGVSSKKQLLELSGKRR